jgi:hypothetical protein
MPCFRQSFAILTWVRRFPHPPRGCKETAITEAAGPQRRETSSCSAHIRRRCK